MSTRVSTGFRRFPLSWMVNSIWQRVWPWCGAYKYSFLIVEQFLNCFSCSYLADKKQLSEQLYPKTLEERARVDEFLEWQHLTLRLACGKYFLDSWLLPINGIKPKPKPEQIDQLVKQVESNLGLVERLWLEKDFLTGQNLTIADLYGSSEIEQLSKLLL